MLKFIYTETPLHLELLSVDLEDWVEQRRSFAGTIGQSLLISSGSATFLLPEPIFEVTAIDFYLHCEGIQDVSVERCDLNYIEVALNGYWLCNELDPINGIFIARLPDRVELYLWQLWCVAKKVEVAEDGVIW
jgi:hypothetical protein